MEKSRLYLLLSKYQNLTLSEDEREELSSFLESIEGQELLNDIWNDNIEIYDDKFSSLDLEVSANKIFSDERLTLNTPVRKFRYSRLSLTVAASIILILCAGIAYLYQPIKFSMEQVSLENNRIIPGSKDARMEFDDGSFVEFNQITKDTILKDKGLKVLVDEEGNVSYELLRPTQDAYATLVTPKGGEYNLTLADGSKVWLNSQSSIRYPLTFHSDERIVYIEGEVYFEVAKFKKGHQNIPFKVHCNNQLIEVLGTAFNVNAYQKTLYTTLVEGSIAVSNTQDMFYHKLIPNQQFVYNTIDKKTAIKEIDPYYVVSWKNGKFAFQGASIEKVMEDLARWYDIDVAYKGDFENISYSGTISRMDDFEEVLKIIELTNQLKFKIEGRRILVMNK